MASPFFKIMLLNDEKKLDITPKFDNRLISMTIEDNNGFEADTIDLVIDDSDQKIKLPQRGAKLEVTLGWSADNQNTTINNKQEVILGANIKNIFNITQVTHSGAPDIITIRGASANLSEKFINKLHERMYDNITINTLVSTIASTNTLPYRCSEEIGSIKIFNVYQTKESDSSFLTRIIDEYGGGMSIKNGMLLVFKKGQGITVNGKAIPPAVIKRESGNSHSYTINNDSEYTGVKAFWYDYSKPEPEQHEIIYTKKTTNETTNEINNETTNETTNEINNETNNETNNEINNETNNETNNEINNEINNETNNETNISKSETDDKNNEDKIKIIRYVYATKESAEQAAKTTMEKIERGIATFSLKLALGRPDLFTEMPVRVEGFKEEINSTDWTIKKCTHSLSRSSGFTTEVTLTIKP